MKRSARLLVLIAFSTAVALATAEVVLRIFSSPSESSSARIWRVDLPPIEVIPASPRARFDRSQWYGNLIVGGKKITVGDLWGYHRYDPLLGYAPRENVISANGWWQSNNLGARRRSPTRSEAPPGKTRVLVFGESYSSCSRVAQEETWPHFLELRAPGLEVVNLAVDGYSMGQSFLRYGLVRTRLAYDGVLLVMAPTADLWREVNVVRSLKEPWDNHFVMPRFVVQGGELRLIRPLYESESELYRSNPGGPSTELLEFLRRYDRFYSDAVHEPWWLTDSSFLGKLAIQAVHTMRKRRLLRSLSTPDSEAMRIVREISLGMSEEAADDGADFALVFLPTSSDIQEMKKNRAFAERWRVMVSWLCGGGLRCLDLSGDLVDAPPDTLDRGYDGSHHGPRTNRLIGELLARRLQADGAPGFAISELAGRKADPQEGSGEPAPLSSTARSTGQPTLPATG